MSQTDDRAGRPPPDENRAYNAFLRRFAADEAAGKAGRAVDYLSSFPAAERRIKAFFSVSDTVAEPPSFAAAACSLSPIDSAGSERRIGHYVIERTLGRGGQGEVHLARDATLGRRVALKTCLSSAVDDLRRFRREAEIGSRFDHPGLCPVYEAGEADGVPYLAMRFVAGRGLDVVIAEDGSAFFRESATPAARNRAICERAARTTAAVARALHHAHEKGVIHRDVKPGNIVLDAADEPVVLDFGIARADDGATKLTQTGVAVGTPAYLAPEQLDMSGPALDRRVDVYALGVVLYRWLTNAAPYAGENREDLYRAILIDTPVAVGVKNPGVPRELASIVRVAMAKDRRDRYATAAAFADDLERFLAGERVLANPDAFLQKARRFLRKRGAVLLATTLVFAAVASAFVFWRSGGDAADAGDRAKLEALLDGRLLSVESLPERSLRAFGGGAGSERAVREETAFAEGLVSDLPRLTARRDDLIAAAREPDADDEARRRAAKAAEACVLVESLQSADPATSFLASLRLRARYFDELGRLAADPAFDAAWRRVIDGLPQAEATADGAPVEPDVTLLPLGPNAEGRQEFEDVWTIEPPAVGPWIGDRAPEPSGYFPRSATGGVVYVLIPPGQDADGRAIGSFFLAKDELSQRTMVRVGARDPAAGAAEVPAWALVYPQRVGAAAEWTRYVAVLRARLPTESEWEHAALGGGGGPYPWGSDPPSGRAASGLREEVATGTFAPNGYGLRDLAGNYAEWCLATVGNSRFVLKGGAYSDGAEALKIKARAAVSESAPKPAGLRLARSIRTGE